MTGRGVPDRDMPGFLWPGRRDVPMIEDTSLAALLAGAELPPGSGPQLRPLAEALAELRARPARGELAGEAEILAAFRDQFGAPHTAHRPPARTPRSRGPLGRVVFQGRVNRIRLANAGSGRCTMRAALDPAAPGQAERHGAPVSERSHGISRYA